MGYADTVEDSLDEGVRSNLNCLDEGEEKAVEGGAQEVANSSNEVLPIGTASLPPCIWCIFISANYQPAKITLSQFQAENHRVPFFRYFGPTAIVPGFKQMVVSVRKHRRSISAGSAAGSKYP